jgi:hypothetical protein
MGSEYLGTRLKHRDAKFLPHTHQRVWQELEYRIDVCRVTRGVPIENL